MSNILQMSYMDGPINYCAVEGRELVIVPRRSVGRKLHFVLTIRTECGLEREGSHFEAGGSRMKFNPS